MSFNSDQVQVQFPERKRVFTFARARGAQYDVLVSIVVSIPASMPNFFLLSTTVRPPLSLYPPLKPQMSPITLFFRITSFKTHAGD